MYPKVGIPTFVGTSLRSGCHIY